ncbi:MAG: HAD family hydrolase, partial [Paracoccaceae bacterium]
MSFRNFRVMTFDVVGTLIDFETGLLTSFRRIGGKAAEGLTDDDIFAPYLEGRDLHYGRSSEEKAEVYLHTARALGFPATQEA